MRLTVLFLTLLFLFALAPVATGGECTGTSTAYVVASHDAFRSECADGIVPENQLADTYIAAGFAASLVVELNGDFALSSSLVLPTNGKLFGQGIRRTNVELQGEASVTVAEFGALEGITFVGAGSHTESCVYMDNGSRQTIQGVEARRCGQDGFTVREGNLARVDNIIALSNTRDGIRFEKLSDITNSNNQYWTSLDIRGNTCGIRLIHGRSNWFVGASLQANGTAACFDGPDARGNFLEYNDEANANPVTVVRGDGAAHTTLWATTDSAHPMTTGARGLLYIKRANIDLFRIDAGSVGCNRVYEKNSVIQTGDCSSR